MNSVFQNLIHGRIEILKVLLQVCDKYNLSKEVVIKERARYGNIPNTIEECESYEK
jgi:hypothetical protein